MGIYVFLLTVNHLKSRDVKRAKSHIQENTLLLGFPSNGLVGIFSISYLIHHLNMKQIGEIKVDNLPPTLFVEDGEILAPIRVYSKKDIFVIISDIPFNQNLAEEFALEVYKFCKKNTIKKILIISGMETANQQEKSPKIYGLATHSILDNLLYSNEIPKFLNGSIFGTDASIISIFRKTKIPTLMLYAECHPFFPDPEASIGAIATLAKILKVSVNTTDIQNKIDKLRIQYRSLMEDTIRAAQQKEKPVKAPQIYR